MSPNLPITTSEISSRTLQSNAARSLGDFQEWLKHEIAKSSDIGYTRIDFSLSLDDVGMSSVHLVRLSGEMEKLLDIEIEPTLLYEFDTIDEMCAALWRMHMGRKERSKTNKKRRVIRVVSSFTAEPIEPSIRYLLSALAFDAEVQFAGYNQVFQELLNPQGVLATNDGPMVHVVLLRIEDWFRFEKEAPSPDKVTSTVDEFIHALEALAQISRVPMIVGLTPHSPQSVRRLQLSEQLAELDARILRAAEGLSGVIPLDLRQVQETYPVARIWDETRDQLGHIPYTQQCYSAMGAAISRRIAALLIESYKVLVLDCDNTLWGGICGEDGPAGVDVFGPWSALQAFVVAQATQGKLVCLCSKNNEADVWATFDAHPEMPLRQSHIVAHRINWGPKSENIRALAEELGLALNSFVFLDDNALEISEVSSALPDVLAIQLPNRRRMMDYLVHHWVFDKYGVTAEDRRRTEMYRENRERSALRNSASTLADFLGKLELKIDIASVADEDLERAAQLTHRTNQFNAHKLVRSEAEIRELRAQANRVTLRIRVADRFGDYGFVGLISAFEQRDENALVCDTFLMSCRVLGRRVEHSLVLRLAEEARARNLSDVVVHFVPSARNTPIRNFLGSIAMGLEPARDGDRLEVRFAATMTEKLLEGAREERAPAEGNEKVAQQEVSEAHNRVLAGKGFDEIARLGSNVDSLVTAIESNRQLHRPHLSTQYVTPRSSWEKKIAAIWRDVLGVDRVGIYDDFYELGGDSLRAAEAFARMWDLGVPESISLQTIVEPTVSSLARAIEDVKAGRTPSLLADRFSLEHEGQLDEAIRHEGYDVETYDQPMKIVLLTGGTGYLGAFLIHELVRQTDAEILCLVRGSTVGEARERIRANLRRYDLWSDTIDARLDIVLGDLVEPCLGLSEEAFAALAQRIDTIFHSAAWVNFVYPYQHLKATNVDSTETILRLAVAAKPKPIQVHYISTLGVIMSTGYGRDNPVHEEDPLRHCDDLLNGYEQTKYASDKMIWTAFKERGIPGSCYRPGMVSGLSNGTYHKLDEFLPQFLKGCIQLGSWPLLDTTFEMAPVDFVSKAIVHIARRPKNLNKAYFLLHPDSRKVSEYIDWHRNFGYEVRGLPWDVWKRELLNLGTERLRKNALFPFVDFIRALSEEQVYFPPTTLRHFEQATADLDVCVPPQIELLERYTRYFIDCGYYENLPSGPRVQKPSEATILTPEQGVRGQLLDERIRFDPNKVDFSEAYYVLWNDPKHNLSMVVRYVLHNGILEETKIAEVWVGFRDENNPRNDVAIRQRYPVGRAEAFDDPAMRLRIGPSGYGEKKIWGEVRSDEHHVRWEFTIDTSKAVRVNRVPVADDFELYPHFQSNGCRSLLSGTVTVNGRVYEVDHVLASDGHYWNTKHLRSWAWAHCSQFEGDPDFMVEGIGARFNDWSQTSTWLTFLWKGRRFESSIVDAFHFNREVDCGLESWGFVAERGDLRFKGHVSADPRDMSLLVHPLPDDEYLYTHISYCADMTIDIERKQGGRFWKVDTRHARRTAAFEITRKQRNPKVLREFRIVKVR